MQSVLLAALLTSTRPVGSSGSSVTGHVWGTVGCVSASGEPIGKGCPGSRETATAHGSISDQHEVIQLIEPVQLTGTDHEIQTASDHASRVAGQTELEQDIMNADGSYFIPVDSGSIETKTMTVVTSDGAANGSKDDAASEDFTEVAFSRGYQTKQGTGKDQADKHDSRTANDGSEGRVEQPQLNRLVQMLEQEANGVSSVDRKLSASQQQGTTDSKQPRTLLFIGIMTDLVSTDQGGFGGVQRREIARETWLQRAWATEGLEAKFVSSSMASVKERAAKSSPELWDELVEEQESHGEEFMHVDALACEGCGAKKYLQFLAKVVKRYDPVYILRVSDDMAVAPQRLPAAVAQWVAMGTDYIGCMAQKEPKATHKPITLPQNAERDLVASQYPTFAQEGAYALAGSVAKHAVLPNSSSLRHLEFEGTTVGLWMLGFRVNYFDDPRLCALTCSVPALAVQMTSSANYAATTTPIRRLSTHGGKRLLAPQSQAIDIEGCYSTVEVFETRLPGFSSFLGTDLGTIDDGSDSKSKGINRPRLPFSRSVDDNVVFNSMHALADAYRV